MTLSDFLSANTPLTAVDLLPDNRLINVVIGNGALYGVQVDNIQLDVTVTRATATLSGTTITAGALTFTTTQYEMLD
jgi:hypothetical protein